LAVFATLLTFVGAVATTTPAGAAVSGAGTALVGTSILNVDVGDGLLGIGVLTDASRSNLDKLQGATEAATALRPLDITSNVPALAALNKSVPTVEARTTGAEDKESAGIDLGSLGLEALADGQLSLASLFAIVDGAGARSGITSEALTNLALVGGLLDLDAVNAVASEVPLLSTNAGTSSTEASRLLDVGAINVLNLGALLDGLGIPLGDLSLDQVLGMLEGLDVLNGAGVTSLLSGLGLPALPADADAADVQSTVDTVEAAIADAVADLASLNGLPLCDATVILADPLASLVGVPVGTTCAAALSAVNTRLTGDRGDLTGLLNGLLGILDGMELLSIDGVDAGVQSKATDDINTSVAKVTGAIGDITVGGITIPGLDLLATAQQLTDTAESALDTIDGVLGTIDPDLAGIVNVELLDTSGTGVTKQNGYVQSVASLVGVAASITPPADLAGVISGLPATSITDTLLASVPGAPAAALPNAAGMQAVEAALGGGALQALANGASLEVASVVAGATFLPGAAPATAQPTPTSGQLPRTGGTTGIAAMAAGFLFVLAIAVRRRVLAPVRIDD
jgi:hypothetical protein